MKSRACYPAFFCAVLTAVLTALSGCRATRPEVPLTWALLEVRPANVSITKQKLQLRLLVTNPGPRDRALAHVFYTLRIADEVLVDGRAQRLTRLPVGRPTDFRIQAVTGLGGLGLLLSGRSRDANYELSGYAVRADVPGKHVFRVVGKVRDLTVRPLSKAKPGL